MLVNAPPTSGFLTVEPTTGVVLQTAFSFACSGWVDDATDLPLLYSFFFEIYGADGTEYQLVAKTPTTSYSGALLPQGGGNASWIVGIGYIYDQLSASARASATIVCAPAVISVSDLANLTASLIAESFESGDVEAVFQATVASSSILNAPNCTVLCGTFSRGPCPIQQTCGDCVEGFVGLPGPINDPCWIADATCDNGVLDGNETAVDCGGACAPCEEVGTPCATYTDCYYGMCELTEIELDVDDLEAGGVPPPAEYQLLCAAPVKPCPNNCTQHGACVHTDVTGAHVPAEECTLDVWSCSASCLCREGWFGDDCSADPLAWAEIIALRNGMLGSLTDATGMQDVGVDALNQQASSLSSLASDPSQLAGGGELASLDLVGGIAGSSAGVGLSPGTDGTVGNTISNLLSSGLLSSNRTSNISTYAPTMSPSIAPTWIDPRFRRNFTALLGPNETWSPTFAPTVTLADSEVLTAMTDAISSLSAAQLSSAVAGEAAAVINTANVMMSSGRA